MTSMVLEVTVGLCWWCPCGLTISGNRGAAQLVREHITMCSFANRLIDKAADNRWVEGLTIRGDGREWRSW